MGQDVEIEILPQHWQAHDRLLHSLSWVAVSEQILGLHPADERRLYFVMTSLIGWVQA